MRSNLEGRSPIFTSKEFLQILIFKVNHKLNLYKKAKLANSFK